MPGGVRWLAVLVSLSGCDAVFGVQLDHDASVPGDGDGPGDGQPCGSPVCDAPAGSPPPLLISEFSVAGLDGTCSTDQTDELIELYNAGPVAVRTSAFAIECAPSQSTGFVRCAELPADDLIVPYGFYLVASASYIEDTCGSVPVPPDAILTGSLTSDSGAIRIVGAGAVVIDRVAWGANPAGEGSALAPWPAPGWSQVSNSAERKATASSTAASMAENGTDATAGNGRDSDDNLADFVFRSGRWPQNKTSPPEPP